MIKRAHRSSWALDVIRGASSGLAASWIMTKAQARMSKLGDASVKAREKRAMNDEPATYKAAQALARGVGAQLDAQDRAKGGTIVHYAYGAGWGAVYGLLNRGVRLMPAASGLLFGGLLWLLSDEMLVPLFGFSRSPGAYPASVHTKALAAHLVYGSATAAGVRVLAGLSHR